MPPCYRFPADRVGREQDAAGVEAVPARNCDTGGTIIASHSIMPFQKKIINLKNSALIIEAIAYISVIRGCIFNTTY